MKPDHYTTSSYLELCPFGDISEGTYSLICLLSRAHINGLLQPVSASHIADVAIVRNQTLVTLQVVAVSSFDEQCYTHIRSLAYVPNKMKNPDLQFPPIIG